MKAIKQVMKKDQEPYRVPKRVQDVIPIKRMWNDGIFLAGNRYSKTFKFTDINYMVASQEAQKKLFLAYAALINSLDCGATTKITLNNRHLNRKNFADTVLMKLKNDYLDYYRMEYNDVIMSKATGGNGIIPPLSPLTVRWWEKSGGASSSFSASVPTIPKRNAGIWRKKPWDSGFLPTKTTK